MLLLDAVDRTPSHDRPLILRFNSLPLISAQINVKTFLIYMEINNPTWLSLQIFIDNISSRPRDKVKV